MKRFIIFCALASLTVAAVIPEEAQAEIVKYENTKDEAGNYKFSYQTSNGITREETGHLVNAGKEDEHYEIFGSYSYIDSEGKPVIVNYRADENGYQVDKPGLTPQITPISVLPGAAVATLLGK